MPSRNEPCPCGSGKKFKKCCYREQFSYQENEEGSFDRLVPIDDDLANLFSKHIDSLGPDVSPDTPLFEATDFERMEHSLSMAMKAAGIDPAIIYAFEETGMMVTEENMDAFPQKDLDLWQSKIEEFQNGSIVDDRDGINDSNIEFPLGTIAHYGPDDKQTTKIVVAVILHATAEPILRRFVGSKVKEDPKIHLGRSVI